MPETPPRLGIVVNYYTKFSSPKSREILIATTSLSLRLLVVNPTVSRVILVDGSEKPDEAIQSICHELDVGYYHDGQEISYCRAYNIGWQSLDEPYIGLMANDIIPHPLKTMQLLLDWIQKPDVGCVFPYLSSNRIYGDEVQQPGFFPGRNLITCEPSTMTLNLNLFKRSVLERIDGLDENYLVGFAEPILLIKIRSMGLRAVMVGGTQAFHYDSLTKELGESSLGKSRYYQDVDRWFKEYPYYAARWGIANIDVRRWPFSTTIAIKMLWWFTRFIPLGVIRNKLNRIVMWLEPNLTKYPTPYGKAKNKIAI